MAISQKQPITKLTPTDRQAIRRAVWLAVQYWPNAHLGEITPREDIRSAFRRIRSWTPSIGLLPSIYRVEEDAYHHAGM